MTSGRGIVGAAVTEQVDSSAVAEVDRERERAGVTRNVVFAAPPNDPRARRPADVATLVSSLIVLVLVAWAYRSRVHVDAVAARALSDTQLGWLDGLSKLVFAAAGVYTVALVVGIALFGGGRTRLVRDLIVAALVALTLVGLAALLAGSGVPSVLPELGSHPQPPPFPVARLAVMAAVLGAATPALAAPMRRTSSWFYWLATLAALVADYGTVSGVIGATMVGAAAAATVHLIFGSSLGVPSPARIRAAFADAGVEVASIDFLPSHRSDATVVKAATTVGGPLYGRFYSRDASDAALVMRLWRWVWYRDSDSSLAPSRRTLAEHEALALLTAERGHASTPRLVCAGRSSTDDVLVATQWRSGTLFGALTDENIDDALIASLWRALCGLHRCGMTHGDLSGDAIIVGDAAEDGDRSVTLCNLNRAHLTPRNEAVVADIAQMVAATAVKIGPERAAAGARAATHDTCLTTEQLTDAIAYVQPGNLPQATRAGLRRARSRPKAIRSEVSNQLGIKTPQLAPLRRFSWRGAVVMALSLFACYNLWNSIADIGFSTIANEMRGADWDWVLIAFLAAQLTSVGKTMALSAQIGVKLPFGPSLLFRYALSFVGIALPGGAGTFALNIRFLEHFGVPPAAAVARGPLNSAVVKIVEVTLLLLSLGAVSTNIDWSNMKLGSGVELGGAVVIAAIVSVVVILAVPKLRELIAPQIKIGWDAIKGALTDPHRLGAMFAGTLLSKVLYAVTLAASSAAYGHGLTLAEAIFVNTTVSVLVGLIPVPGGVGVGETALTSGLMAVGVPKDAAAAAAITHRVVSTYLPILFGAFASRWLARRSYI